MTKSPFSAEHERLRSLLIEARRAAGMTQVDLARHLQHPQSYVSKYERGERRLDVIEFIQITQALDVDPCDLIRRLLVQ